MTYSDTEKNTIKTLKESGTSWKVIGEVLGKSPRKLRAWYSRNRVNFDLPPKTIIKKRITDGRIGSAIKRIAKEKPTLPVRDYMAELSAVFGPDKEIPKKSSINNFLLENGLKIIKLKKKQFISNKNISKRLKFATQNMSNLDDLMYRTIWSDETTVRKHPKSQEIFFRCHQSTSEDEKPFNHQLQMGGFNVMFWGCFSNLGLGPLVVVEGSQNTHTYLQMLKDYLVPEIQAAFLEHGVKMVFMQDNAPCHKSKPIMDFLKDQNIATLEWPPQSPDLNPNENLWAIIKKYDK